MGKAVSERAQKEQAALLYGIQRSGSNYTLQLLLRNFQNIRFYNHGFPRCLPTHKHFRLYDEKSAIPDKRFFNAFKYKSFKDFKQHAEQVAEKKIDAFIICIKDPYSWYLSYKKHARKNKYPYFKKSLNSHYLIDYNLFYGKWLDFSIEAPEEVMMLRYEDLIEDMEGSLALIAKKFNLERSSTSLVNPDKVPMSREFSQSRLNYYKEKKYLDLISDQEKSVIQQLLDPKLISGMDYKIESIIP